MEAYGPHSRLPNWNRPGLGVQGTLHKDDEASLPQVKFRTLSRGSSRRRKKNNEEERGPLEKNIAFIRQQHVETLQQLQMEAERLKKYNRELTFKLIMCRCGRGSSGTTNCSTAKHQSPLEARTPTDELQMLILQEETIKLRRALAIERCKSARLLQLLQQKLDQDKTNDQDGSGFRGTLPSLQVYEATIRRLQHEKEQKAHELTQIKADLRDILYSDKWTPAAYLLARAYVFQEDENAEASDETERAPVPQDCVYQRVQEGLKLPALRPYLPSDVAAKQRRRQAIREKTVGKILSHHDHHAHDRL